MNDRRWWSALLVSVLLLGLVLPAFDPVRPAYAALGWVGGMFPAGGSTTEMQMGDAGGFTVYVQVYKAGVTEGAGQGAGIQCFLHWGPPGGTWSDLGMSYNRDIGNNDEYRATIATAALAAGTYGFTAYCTDDGGVNKLWQGDGDGFLSIWDPGGPADARAMWVDASTLAWNAPTGSTYKLHYDPDGGLDLATSAYITLIPYGTIGGYPQFPNATGLPALKIGGADLALVPQILRGQVVVAAYDGSGTLLRSTGVQMQGALDDLYAYDGDLGVTYNSGVPTLRLWAPTARSVTLRRYADATTATYTTHPMVRDNATGVWWLVGTAAWDRDYYLYDVEVYVPSIGQVEHNLVTDPYSLNLSQNSARSQIVDLFGDASLEPAGWDTFGKPALAAFEDISVYEVHVRDFSIDDSTVAANHRGTFAAFTYDGAGPNPNPALSDGMDHLLQLQDAGLTHVHLLPAFDIASVDEDATSRVEPAPDPSDPRDSENQQAEVAAHRAEDGFNWGYDPLHYGAPEGSYATAQNDTARILEFRAMVQTLNQNGLRVVMDVVYNHTSASGQSAQSVLDRVVPGYYHRYDSTGTLQNSSCCSDTAAEFHMMEKLMVDTVVLWATAYKVDGFRFDLMNLHTVENMQAVQAAVRALTPAADGVDGGSIYIYGEGWDFGSAAAKGLHYAKQWNVGGTGIGTFNDKIRDAAHGGYSTDPLQIRHQGFINGLSYDWNGYLYNNRDLSDLKTEMDRLRMALAGSLRTYNFRNSSGTYVSGQDLGGYTLDPQETVNYVSKHDNETLYDNNVFKAPTSVSMADRVRIQNMGLSLVGLAQGVPFFQLGSDMLRSKSLDRNSYDSGDWFNRVDFTYAGNNFGVGLPPAWDNSTRWDIMRPLLADSALSPSSTDIQNNVYHLREILQIRSSSPLFRLRGAADANARVRFYPTGDAPIIVMSISDMVLPDLDPNYEEVFVLFNAGKTAQPFTIGSLAGRSLTLHPVQQSSHDPTVRTATFTSGTGTFNVPARTTAVFVDARADSTSAVTEPGWVGKMYPAGGSSTERVEGDGSGLTVYVQVWKSGATPTTDGTAVDCYLHWGRVGGSWTDMPMAFNPFFGHPSGSENNDEYFATIPTGELEPGTYGFTAFCTGQGNTAGTQTWRQPADGGDGYLSITPRRDPDPMQPSNPDGVAVHLFEWSWSDVQQECPYLAEQGYTAVQVSPPQEHILGSPWWTRYQPVSYLLTQSRGGTLAQFQAMVDTCNTAGVDVYVDAVLNHMTAGSGTGTAGSSYTQYDYPAVPYVAGDFHTACDIGSYAVRSDVQNCRLVGLSDLDTGSSSVQAKMRAYLNALIDMGVAGFRIDAAKHIFAADLEGMFDGLHDLPDGRSPYIFQEVIEAYGELPNGFEYYATGDVKEFDYERGLNAAFEGVGGTLGSLSSFGSGSGFMPGAFAIAFTNNHDDQRQHPDWCVSYQDGTHDLANVFMLAWPYGYPKVMSSYYFSDHDQGPPSTPVYNGGSPSGCDGSNWVCEHRRPALAHMVAFRAATAGEPVVYWWDNGNDQIAFGRGSRGYVAINREGSPLARTFQTGMAPGLYCDVTEGALLPDGSGCSGPAIAVDGSGRIVNQTVGTMSAFAIHTGAQVGTIEALAAVPGVVPGGSTAANARVTSGGAPVVGATVGFAILDGGGSLSAASATTNGDGLATVDYTAPGASAVVRLRATVTVAGVVYSDDTIVHVAAATNSGATTATATGNPYTLDRLAALNARLVKRGSSAPTVGLAQFGGNPCPDSQATGRYAVSPFVDVLLERGAGVQDLQVTVRYTGEMEEGQHTLYWCNDGQWQPVAGGAVGVDSVNNTLSFTLTARTAPSLDQLEGTPFVAAGTSGSTPLGPTAVLLAGFEAVPAGPSVRLQWETVNELHLAGFNLYRSLTPAGGYVQLNGAPIDPQQPGTLLGAVYAYTDTAVLPGTTYYYQLESRSTTGLQTFHGPVSATTGRAIYLPLVHRP